MTNSPTDSTRFLPVGLDVRGKACIVVGGGVVGTRKVFNLTRAGATVTVVAPVASREIADQAESGQIRWVQESFQSKCLAGAFLVVAATDDKALNASIVRGAIDVGALVCDASSADRSQVIFGALHRLADGVTVAVFTDGRDPAAARRARNRIAALLDNLHMLAKRYEGIGLGAG